ncbi:unnamed protein product [Chironomus riparius]|uniref:Uncharacterized protein n=1 Tax=Chironomus riparius TaxID=315576 RepID=A0A9N9S8Q8_9DIPT|nr:unnamed protein product [Chironomus riparius]
MNFFFDFLIVFVAFDSTFAGSPCSAVYETISSLPDRAITALQSVAGNTNAEIISMIEDLMEFFDPSPNVIAKLNKLHDGQDSTIDCIISYFY